MPPVNESSPGPMPRKGARGVLVNTIALTTASFWRIVVSFATQLLVARLLDVSALGVFTLTLAWLHIGQIATEAGLPAWMVREVAGHPDRRRSVYRHLMRVQVCIALLAWALFALLAYLLPVWMPPLPIVLLAGASLPFYALMSAGLSLFESSEAMPLVLRVDVVANTLLLAGTVLALWLGYGIATVFGVLAVAQALAALLTMVLVRHSRLATGASADPALHWQSTLRSATPFFAVTFTDVLQQRADLLLLGAFASPAVTGIYAAATSILRVAVKLIQAYWRALYPTLSRLRAAQGAPQSHANAANFTALADFALRVVLVLAFGMALLGTLISDTLVVLLFGIEFAASGPVLAILLWSAPFYAWEIRSITLLQSARKQHLAARVTFLHLATLAASLLLVMTGASFLRAAIPALAGFDAALGTALAVLLSSIVGALIGAIHARREGLPAGAALCARVAACAAGALLASLLATFAFNFAFRFAGSNVILSMPVVALIPLLAALFAYALLLIAARLLRAQDVRQLRRAFAPR